MQDYSEQELNDLFDADDAIQSFLLESTMEGNEYWELEEYVSELNKQD